MKSVFKILWPIIVFLALTIITQVGGLVYVFWKGISILLRTQIAKCRAIRILGFPVVYLIFALLITPQLASYYGRVPLPITETNGLKPASIITCVLNRHYVTKQLADLTYETATKLQVEYPSVQLVYLDANFPFIDEFPLLPHWSHSDGKKLDLAFVYSNNIGSIVNDQPTYFGYGSFEPASESERNATDECVSKGYFHYSALKYFTWFPDKLVVHQKATSYLIKILHQNSLVGKIFIEPHLKTRWGLSKLNKIRFHGCHAVRHDDHIHFQLN